MTWLIVDKETGYTVGLPIKSISRARAKVDRLDNAHGGYKYRIKCAASGKVSL